MLFNTMARCIGVSTCPDFTRCNIVSLESHFDVFRSIFFFLYQISPNSLAEGGVEVTRVVQKEGQFVVVFPEVMSRRAIVRTLF